MILDKYLDYINTFLKIKVLILLKITNLNQHNIEF